MRMIDADCLISTTKSATALCAAITGNEAKKEFMKETCNFVCELVGSEPTIPAVLVRHGKWLLDGCCEIQCSCCDETYSDEIFMMRGGINYCPNCGAKMDGGNENA